MAVSPISTPALPAQLPVAAPSPAPTPAAPAATATAVPPPGASDKNRGTGTGTSPQAEDLPIEETLKKINERMQAWSTEVLFSVDEDTKRVVITIKDRNTGDTLKTIPSETALQIAKMITEYQGSAINTSA